MIKCLYNYEEIIFRLLSTNHLYQNSTSLLHRLRIHLLSYLSILINGTLRFD
jgi:hypothetical protein